MGWTTPTSNFREVLEGRKASHLENALGHQVARSTSRNLRPWTRCNFKSWHISRRRIWAQGNGVRLMDGCSCVFFGSKKIYGNLRGPTSSMQSPQEILGLVAFRYSSIPMKKIDQRVWWDVMVASKKYWQCDYAYRWSWKELSEPNE